MCKQVGLDHADIQNMTVGMCLDYIEEYIGNMNKGQSSSGNSSGGGARRATQADMDNF